MHQIDRKSKITNLFSWKNNRIIKFSDTQPSGCMVKLRNLLTPISMLKLFLNVCLPVLDIGFDIQFTYKCFKNNDVKYGYVSGFFCFLIINTHYSWTENLIIIFLFSFMLFLIKIFWNKGINSCNYDVADYLQSIKDSNRFNKKK